MNSNYAEYHLFEAYYALWLRSLNFIVFGVVGLNYSVPTVDFYLILYLFILISSAYHHMKIDKFHTICLRY